MPVTPTARPPWRIDERDDVGIDQPAEHHLHHVHGGGIGHTHTVHEFRFDIQARQQLTDLRSTAVHDDDVDAHQFHQHDIGSEAVFERSLGHGVTAVFDDHSRAMKAANVGQRFGQYLAGDVVLGCGHSALHAPSISNEPALGMQALGTLIKMPMNCLLFVAGFGRGFESAVDPPRYPPQSVVIALGSY